MSLVDLDFSIVNFAVENLHSAPGDVIMQYITARSFIVIIPFVAAAFYRDRKKALTAFIIGIAAFVLADWMGSFLKEVIGRPRPFEASSTAHHSFSMPSNHAANIFAFVIPFYFYTKGKAKHGMMAVALLVGFSRIYLGAHYPTDVIVGALLGGTMASVVAFFYSRLRVLPAHRAFFIGFMAAVFLFRMYYLANGPYDLAADEAHYWEWSRRLGLSYYSKGPAIAYIIKAGTLLFGNTVFGVRFLAVVLSLLSSVLLYRLGTLLYDEKTGAYAGSLLQVIPLFATYGVLMTIDSPFMFFWILSLLLFYRAERSEKITPWLLLGLTAGLGMLTKYTMAFFHICALLYLGVTPEGRRKLRSPGPYLGTLVSLIVFSPVIIWNFMNGWVTFKHTMGHIGVNNGLHLRPDKLLDFIGSQLGVITPVILVLMIISLIRLRKSDRFSFWFSIPILVFFMLKSIQAKVQGNWALPGYITGLFTFSAVYLSGFRNRGIKMKALLVFGIALSVFVTSVAYYPYIVKLSPRLDPASKLRGWKALGKQVNEVSITMQKPFFIFSDRYQVSSELAFYMEGNPETYCVNLGRRMNQYDLWPGIRGFTGENAIFVTIGDVPVPAQVGNAFDTCEKEQFWAYDKWNWDEPVRKYSIFRCINFRGLKGVITDEY